MMVNTCTVCEIGLSTGEDEEDGGIGVLAILRLPTLRVLSCTGTPV